MTLKDRVHGLLHTEKEKLRSLGVARLGLFGSTVSNLDSDTSDVDLLVEFQTGKKNFDNFIELCFFLEDNLGREVDLLTPEGLSPIVKRNIEKNIEYVDIAS